MGVPDLVYEGEASRRVANEALSQLVLAGTACETRSWSIVNSIGGHLNKLVGFYVVGR